MYVMFFNFIEKYWQNQFPTTILWSSLIILDHPWSSLIILYILESFGILTYFWKLLDTFGIYWRFVGDPSSGFHQLSSIIFSKYVQFWHFNILQKQLFLVHTTMSPIWHFSFCIIFPLCLPFLSPRCVSPVCLTVFGSKSSSQPFRLSAKKEQTKRNRAIFKIISGIFHQSIELKCIRQDGQEQLEYSGQLSIKKGWGAWFYRRPTNPPNHLREWLGGIDSIEIVNLKIPWGLWFYRCIFGKGGHVLLIYHYKIVNTNPFT